jgi:hypothetical protein
MYVYVHVCIALAPAYLGPAVGVSARPGLAPSMYIKTPAFQHTIRIVLLFGLYRPPRNLEQIDHAGVRIVAFYTLSGPYRSCRDQDLLFGLVC